MEAEGQSHLIDELMDELEDAWGIKFEPGYNTKLEFMVGACVIEFFFFLTALNVKWGLK